MPGFTTVSRTSATPDEAFAFILDTSEWPRFTGYGPMPGIVHAATVDGAPIHLGSVVEVTNTDGSRHREVVVAFERPSVYAVRMELPASVRLLLDRVEERVEIVGRPDGCEVTRRFEVVPRAVLVWPFAWLIARFLLRGAVERHNANVASLWTK